VVYVNFLFSLPQSNSKDAKRILSIFNYTFYILNYTLLLNRASPGESHDNIFE